MSKPPGELNPERSLQFTGDPETDERFRHLVAGPGSVGLDESGRLTVELADGRTVQVAQSSEVIGDLVTKRGSGHRLLLFMGLDTGDDETLPPTVAEIDKAVANYRAKFLSKSADKNRR